MVWISDPCFTSVLVGCEDSNHFWSKTTANQFLFNSISKCFRFNFHSKDTSKSSYSFQLWQRYITNTTKLQGKLDVRKLKLMTRGDKKSYTSILKHPAKKKSWLVTKGRNRLDERFLRNHKTCLGLDLKKNKQTTNMMSYLAMPSRRIGAGFQETDTLSWNSFLRPKQYFFSWKSHFTCF